MPSVSDEISINGTGEAVFAALADPEVQVGYDRDFRSVEKLTQGPIGKGTRFRGDFKGMGKVEYEYAEFEPIRLIEHAVKWPFGAVRHRFDFQPSGDGTRLAQAITLRPNLLGRLLWPLLLRDLVGRRLRTVNRLVKAYVEG